MADVMLSVASSPSFSLMSATLISTSGVALSTASACSLRLPSATQPISSLAVRTADAMLSVASRPSFSLMSAALPAKLSAAVGVVADDGNAFCELCVSPGEAAVCMWRGADVAPCVASIEAPAFASGSVETWRVRSPTGGVGADVGAGLLHDEGEAGVGSGLWGSLRS